MNGYLTPEMINTAITMVIIPLFGLITMDAWLDGKIEFYVNQSKK